MAKEKKYTVQEVCDIFDEAIKKGGPAVMDTFRERQVVADMVGIRSHPPMRNNDGVQPGINWMEFEMQVGRSVEELMRTSEQPVLHEENVIPAAAKTWVIGDYLILTERYDTPEQKGIRNDLVIFHVTDGKLVGLEAWGDPINPEELRRLYNIEKKVRETIPYPDQTGVIFDDKGYQIAEETAATIKKIAADLEAGNTSGGGQGLVAALRKYVADEVSIRHHPAKKYVDGKTNGKLWLDFEDAIIGMVTKTSEDTKPVETWFMTINTYIFCHKTRVLRQPDGSKKTCRSLVVWSVVNGKITDYGAWYDSMPEEVWSTPL